MRELSAEEDIWAKVGQGNKGTGGHCTVRSCMITAPHQIIEGAIRLRIMRWANHLARMGQRIATCRAW